MFRFTIRDVLWLTVVVGLGMAWWTEHRRAADLATQWATEKDSWNADRTKKDNLIARQHKQYMDSIFRDREMSARIDNEWKEKMRKLISPVPPPPPSPPEPADPLDPFAEPGR